MKLHTISLAGFSLFFPNFSTGRIEANIVCCNGETPFTTFPALYQDSRTIFNNWLSYSVDNIELYRF